MLVLSRENWEADLTRAALSEFALDKLTPIVENIVCGRGKMPKVQNHEEFMLLAAETPLFMVSGRCYRFLRCGKTLSIQRVTHDERANEDAESVWASLLLKRVQVRKRASIPEFPESGLNIANKDCVSAAVTRHAWQRFCERVPPKFVMSVSADYFADLLKAAFGRAVPEKLKRGGEVRRTINNKFVPAHYFYDAATNMRFVISEDEPKTVITIEQRLI